MFVDSMRAYGIIPCLYFSIWDQASGVPGPYNMRPDTLKWSKYKAFVTGQITELLGGTYGEIPFFVFDGYSWDVGHWAVPFEDIRGLIKKLQPNCLIMDHNGATPWDVDIEYFEEPLGITVPAGNTYPSCQGQTISGDWFWNSTAADSTQLKSISVIVSHLTTEQPRYCNFVLNCPPNRTGQLDAAIVNRLAAVGKAWSPDLTRADLPPAPPRLERPFTPITATATSNGATAWYAIDNCNDGPASNHSQTIWTSSGALPQSVTLDLGRVRDSIDMLLYQPRRFGSTTGNITSYKIYVSTDNAAFTQVTTGTSAGGTWGTWSGDSTIKWARFAQLSGRYVRLEASAVSGGTSAAVNTIVVGACLPYGPTTAIQQEKAPVITLSHGPYIIKTMGTVMLDKRLAGKTNAVAVYDLTGKLVASKSVNGNLLDLKKECGFGEGVFVVKVK
jgi:alpha-L-fucosidase